LDDYWRAVWTVDAHRDGKRFVVRADKIRIPNPLRMASAMMRGTPTVLLSLHCRHPVMKLTVP
jgi:hypothetical protein